MPDWFLAGLSQPGLPWLMALAGIAGVVYGFAYGDLDVGNVPVNGPSRASPCGFPRPGS